jgi:hypothetical protein
MVNCGENPVNGNVRTAKKQQKITVTKEGREKVNFIIIKFHEALYCV